MIVNCLKRHANITTNMTLGFAFILVHVDFITNSFSLITTDILRLQKQVVVAIYT